MTYKNTSTKLVEDLAELDDLIEKIMIDYKGNQNELMCRLRVSLRKAQNVLHHRPTFTPNMNDLQQDEQEDNKKNGYKDAQK